MTGHFTAREFNQDIAAAKRAARDEPVIVTDRGVPAYVLLTYSEYCRLLGEGCSLGDRLSNPEVAVIDFDPPRLTEPGFQAATFD